MKNTYIILPPPIFWKYIAHLLRRTLKIQCIKTSIAEHAITTTALFLIFILKKGEVKCA